VTAWTDLTIEFHQVWKMKLQISSRLTTLHARTKSRTTQDDG